MIKPTIGRIVHYRPVDPSYADNVRFAATIAKVNEDGTVNLGVDNEHGVRESAQNVTLVQDEAMPASGQCEWMPYQKGQAAKYDVTTDDLMARVDRIESFMTGEMGIVLPALALKTPAAEQVEEFPVIAGDDIDPVDHGAESSGPVADSAQGPGTEDIVLAEDDEVITSDDLVDAPDSTDEAADVTASTDDGTSAEASEEAEVLEATTEAPAKADDVATA